MAYSAKANTGRNLDLLHGAGIHMALYFYAMFWVLRIKSVLIAVVHGHEMSKLKLNTHANAAVKDTKNSMFLTFCVCCCLYYLHKPLVASLLRQVNSGDWYSLLFT